MVSWLMTSSVGDFGVRQALADEEEGLVLAWGENLEALVLGGCLYVLRQASRGGLGS